MTTKLILKVLLIVAVSAAAVSLSPAMAAKRTAKKMTGACSQPNGRCISDCDQFNWCTMYTCSNGQSTPIPAWRCYEPSGLCFAPHC